MPKARGTKQKARIQRAQEAQEQPPVADGPEIRFEWPPMPRLGKQALEAIDISKSYGSTKLFSRFNYVLHPGMRVGIVGPNGCGKSTLLRVLMGVESPGEGLVRHGDTARFVYVDQEHATVDPEQSVLQFFSDGSLHWEINGRNVYVPAYLEQFLFDESVTRMAMGALSGGERNRLDLARKLLQGGNILVLDEPTNDLDLPTLRVLEEALRSFAGCALIVSHDRYFLNRVCTGLLVFERSGEITAIAGSYDDYLLYRQRNKQERRDRGKSGKDAPSGGSRNKPARPKREKSGLSYKEKQELAGIAAAIEEAEAKAATWAEAVHDPELYKRDAETIQDTLANYEAARNEVEQLYERWEQLDALANSG